MSRKAILILALLILLLIIGSAALAAPSAYTILWWTVDGGGNTSSAGAYKLSGTTGQPDAGSHSGGSYTLFGGFWGGGSVLLGPKYIYLPLVLKNQ